MATLNKCQFIGNVGSDVDVRDMNGIKMASFRLAVTEKRKDRAGQAVEQTEWVNITCWRGCADVAEKYVRKGAQLYVEGKFHTRQWEDREGNKRFSTEIVADTFQMLGQKPVGGRDDLEF